MFQTINMFDYILRLCKWLENKYSGKLRLELELGLVLELIIHGIILVKV